MSGVRASVTIVRIRKFVKLFRNIVGFEVFYLLNWLMFLVSSSGCVSWSLSFECDVGLFGYQVQLKTHSKPQIHFSCNKKQRKL